MNSGPLIKRLYIDNYKCLVNFEVFFASINLLLGTNGAGKSTIFEVIHCLQLFIGGYEKVRKVFPQDNCTRWQKLPMQRFELDLEGNGGLYKYELSVEHHDVERLSRVHWEKLSFDDKPLFALNKGDALLYRDNHSEGPKYPFDWSQSGIAMLMPSKDNRKLTWFKECIENLIVVGINSKAMESESENEEKSPSSGMENYASWLRYLSQERQGKVLELTQVLREILEGFDSFKIAQAGETRRVLKLGFWSDQEKKSIHYYNLSDLSDGQRALLALYTFLYCSESSGGIICIDEPENFLALPEIQPWLTHLHDLCGDGGLQALLISHHPELIDYMASSSGFWLDRLYNGPVRIKRITEEGIGMPISELIARGWIHE